MHKLAAAIWLAGAVSLCGCSPEPVYEQYIEVPGSVWQRDKQFHFVFDTDDTATPYDITFQIRNTNRYPYQNIWLFVMEEMPVGEVRRDTIEFFLADDYGKWLGQGISVYESSVPIRSSYCFPDSGRYAFIIGQGMRDSSLAGVQEVGMIMRPVSRHGGKRLSGGI